MKIYFYHGITAGIISALAGIVYKYVYQEFMFLDFSKVVNYGSIIGASVFGCMLMAFGYLILEQFNKSNFKGGLNILILLFTFLSILGPLSISLPLDIESPEMFPGLAIPMHFFPTMVFFGLVPFFQKELKNNQ